MTSRRAAPVIAGVVAVGLVVLGVVLVLRGGDDDPGPKSPATTTGPRETIPVGDTSRAGIEQLSGLVLPPSTADFLSARLSDGTELDVTFTMAPGDEAAFVAASGLPALRSGTRVVTHSSPLWKLNPEGTISGATDTRAGVRRVVELVPEGDRLRARVVLSRTG
jgi:hypothetical protein